MIHKDLCNAKYTTYWSPLRMQLHFLFSAIHTWDGEIPLSLKEIKERLNCHIDTLSRLLNEAEDEGIITRKEGKIFFNKCAFDDSTSYVKNFPFLHSLDFRNEDVRVIRFVLHMLATGVYSRKLVFNNSIRNLYHHEIYDKQINKYIRVHQGLFNIYSAADMRKVLDKAKKYLVFALTNDNIVRVVNLKSEYHVPPVKNEGEYYFIKNYLKKYGLEDVSEEKIYEIIKVNSRYLKGLGVELAKEFIKEVLFYLFTVLNGENSTFIHLLLEGEAREVGLYYSKICAEYEQTFAAVISRRQDNIENAFQRLEKNPVPNLEILTEKIRDEKKKIVNFIKRWDEYWLGVINFKYRSPDLIQTILAKIQANPLYENLQQVKQVLKSIHKQSRDSFKPEEFTFYNWLEN